MQKDTARIFESFNARALSPEQVASTFVPSSHFANLAKRRHSMIIGPRGSGKTTLLKMLQQRALEAWAHPDAEEYRARIDYTGVFVPTDIAWSMQLESIGFGELDEATRKLFGYAAFTTHVLRALVEAFTTRTAKASSAHDHRRVMMTTQQEADVVVRLAQAWRCTPILPSLFSLHESLGLRLQHLHEMAAAEALRGSPGRADRIAQHEFLATQFLPAASHAVEVFENVTGASGVWALLFDELEIAPGWVRRELLRLLRSTDQRFLFKLSMSPYDADVDLLATAVSAAPGHDYDEILLWYAHKEDGYAFSEALWKSMTEALEGTAIGAADALGHAPYETQLSEWSTERTAYVAGSRIARDFEELWETDGSFREFMLNRGIDVRLAATVPGDERATMLRKIAPLVHFRKEFRKADREEGGDRRSKPRKLDPMLTPLPPDAALRSRKNPQVYTGVESLFAISEGNPRWLISIADRLMDSWSPRDGQIDRGVQAATISHVARGFGALLRNVPSPLRAERGILDVISRIGRYIFEQVVRKQFTAEPPGSFIVDVNTGQDMERALGAALNIGALVYIPERDEPALLRSVRGKRFRLSYLVAVIYRNPIRLGRAVALSSMLTTESGQQALDWMDSHESRDGDTTAD